MKHKKTLKIIIGFMTILMCMGIFSGCGSEKKTQRDENEMAGSKPTPGPSALPGPSIDFWESEEEDGLVNDVTDGDTSDGLSESGVLGDAASKAEDIIEDVTSEASDWVEDAMERSRKGSKRYPYGE